MWGGTVTGPMTVPRQVRSYRRRDLRRGWVHAGSTIQTRRSAPAEAAPIDNTRTDCPSRILVVDDEEQSRKALRRMLESFGCETELAEDGIEALAKLALDIDLVLLDATMPHIDGFEVAARIRENPEYLNLPIMMVTGLDTMEDRLRAVAAGVNDFIPKPVEIVELEFRTGSLLRLRQAHDQIEPHKTELRQTVNRGTADLRGALDAMVAAERQTHEAHLDTIRRLVLAAEYKDRDTGTHIERIGRYCEVLARGLQLAPRAVEVIRYASPMHDVGKLGIPDAILLKPGQLDPDEWKVMKQHTTMGARILRGSPSQVLQTGEVIALSHHERWDGSGYPKALQSEEIPAEGRICAVADVFDALTSNRHYRDALPNKAVYDMIESQQGRHFDPKVVNAFFDNLEEIEAIQREYCDARKR
jgi:putative two-component system response regulator